MDDDQKVAKSEYVIKSVPVNTETSKDLLKVKVMQEVENPATKTTSDRIRRKSNKSPEVKLNRAYQLRAEDIKKRFVTYGLGL